MDIQMPVMDGLNATRTIRAIERERGLVPVAIVALTANTSPHDVEMSAAAGCNDHLSKPISKRKLLSAIAEQGQPRQALSVPKTRQRIIIQIPPDLADIVPGYLAARKKELPEMMERLAASDFERLRILGHNMKGSGTSYGFPELTQFGAELERFAKQSDGGL
jgi:DNA-binding NarL/FixJ family response regulator